MNKSGLKELQKRKDLILKFKAYYPEFVDALQFLEAHPEFRDEFNRARAKYWFEINKKVPVYGG